jgi:hypothetical protein
MIFATVVDNRLCGVEDFLQLGWHGYSSFRAASGGG